MPMGHGIFLVAYVIYREARLHGISLAPWDLVAWMLVISRLSGYGTRSRTEGGDGTLRRTGPR